MWFPSCLKIHNLFLFCSILRKYLKLKLRLLPALCSSFSLLHNSWLQLYKMGSDTVRIHIFEGYLSIVNQVIPSDLMHSRHTQIDKNLARIITGCPNHRSITARFFGHFPRLPDHFGTQAFSAVIMMSAKTKHVVDFGDLWILFKNVGWVSSFVSHVPNDWPFKIPILFVFFIPQFGFNLTSSYRESQSKSHNLIICSWIQDHQACTIFQDVQNQILDFDWPIRICTHGFLDRLI